MHSASSRERAGATSVKNVDGNGSRFWSSREWLPRKGRVALARRITSWVRIPALWSVTRSPTCSCKDKKQRSAEERRVRERVTLPPVKKSEHVIFSFLPLAFPLEKSEFAEPESRA